MHGSPAQVRSLREAPETATSRRYLAVLARWTPVGRAAFAAWDGRPHTGHFLGGCHWYGLETAAGAVAFAAAASSPEYDPAACGCSRDELRDMALMALRYLCLTHDAGPADCVRPSHGIGRPENFGRKWGERGAGFFPESQCGGTIAQMAMTAALLEDALDAETAGWLRAVCEDYADRFADMPSRSGVYLNTQMEENAWTGAGLAAAACILGHGAVAERAGASAARWLFHAATMPQDAFNRAPLAQGRSVGEWMQEIVTTLPDAMAENHRMVHPSYTVQAIRFLGIVAGAYGLYGRPIPTMALHNRQRVYDEVKRITDGAGYPHPVQGMDWPYHFPDPGTLDHATAALLLGDPDAPVLEDCSLRTLEGIQNSNGGRMWSLDKARVCHDVQDPIEIRECSIASPALTYILHRTATTGGPQPHPRATERRLRGVRTYHHAGFLFHRHTHGQTSAAWRNCLMVLPLTRDGILTVAPASGTLLADLAVAGCPESHDLRSVRTVEQDASCAAAFTVLRAQGSVRQDVLFASLPDGLALLCERLTATRRVRVDRASQGSLRIVNETFPALGDNCRGERILHGPGLRVSFRGYVSRDPGSDTVRELGRPDWLNVDDRLGLVFHGQGPAVYVNRHHFPTWHATADDLTLSRMDDPTWVSAGAAFGTFRALIAPGRTSEQTARLRLVAPACPEHAAALIASGWLAAANFGDRHARILLTEPRRRGALVPVFAGRTRIDAAVVGRELELDAGAVTLRRAAGFVSASGHVEALVTETGEVIVHNHGAAAAEVRTGHAGASIAVPPGSCVRIG